MLATLTTSVVALVGSTVCAPVDHTVKPIAEPTDFRSLYEQGVRYIEFRNAATRRVDAWKDHYANAVAPDALVAKMESIPGTWRLLVVAEDWCGDSANTIPYLAKLVDRADNLDMRIIRSDVGKDIMEAHRTPDGRAATPTVVLLNDRFEEVGCFVERPSTLQTWFLDAENELEEEALYEQKYAWYDDDQGQHTISEIVAMAIAASNGEKICR